jgi:hypothetical protein
MFEGVSAGGIRGNCYALTWDSGDGRVSCLGCVNGEPADLCPEPVYRPGSGWRRMRIRAAGERLTFEVGDDTILSVTDTTFASGQCGIGYHEYFTGNEYIQGTHADNFLAAEVGSASDAAWIAY